MKMSLTGSSLFYATENKVKLNGFYSDWAEVLSGIPQGTQASVDRECPTCLQRHLSNMLMLIFYRLSIPNPNPNPNLKP